MGGWGVRIWVCCALTPYVTWPTTRKALVEIASGLQPSDDWEEADDVERLLLSTKEWIPWRRRLLTTLRNFLAGRGKTTVVLSAEQLAFAADVIAGQVPKHQWSSETVKSNT
jgi:hypothetical protein